MDKVHHVSCILLRSAMSQMSLGGYSHILAYLGMCRLIGYGFQGAQSLNRNRASFLTLWSLDRVPQLHALLKS